ncbi:Homeodomain-like protein [Hysterangium stoloniferum]|nr:Homeodomain-like protein [Hysterangium stoloniferum]
MSRRHYSKDLKDRVIYQYTILAMKPIEIATNLDMSIRVVHRTLQLWQEIGDVIRDPKTYNIRGRPTLMNETACNYMMKLLESRPNMYLDEIALELADTLGVMLSLSTVHRTLKLLGYTTKKVCLFIFFLA